MKINIDKMVSYPVIPLRDIVVFPKMVASLFVGREKSIRALETVMNEEKKIVLLTQKDSEVENPKSDDLYHYGVVASVKQLIKLPDGMVKVMVEGERRICVKFLSDIDGAFHATVTNVNTEISNELEARAIMRPLMDKFEDLCKQNGSVSADIIANIRQIESPEDLSDAIVPHLGMNVEKLQEFIQASNVLDRLEKIFTFIEGEIEVVVLERRIRDRVKTQMEKNQREYYLNEQMKAISKELGDDTVSEMETYKKRIDSSKMPADVKEKAHAELKKLRSMPPISAETGVVKNYLDWITDIPWKKRSKINIDLDLAEKILDEDHYGLEKVKERILEFLAVNIRTKSVKGPILCLVGPPGVGKTSLGESIAKACGRKFVRMSLGGVRDEAEIRGHRRTYVGAMPGKIIQGMKKAGTSNPMFLLDEIEKMGSDHRGDPSSALLEVLDPSINGEFADHYLEVGYDLSDVMFITTANSLNMQGPLLDRMEIINLSGYTEDEKLEIAKRHLVARALKDNGVMAEELEIKDTAIMDIIRYYTREAGVRNLEREIQKIARKSVRKIMQNGSKKIIIDSDNLKDFSGVRKFSFGEMENKDAIGMVTGLAWTSVGGELLHIEGALVTGKGQVIKTGKLGDVMKESISAAETYIRSRAPQLGILPTVYKTTDIHIHVPEGATPKDGPSAGIAMVTAIVSCLTNNPVKRDVAMTGEVTLRGKVLAIGGLKEKLLAALRGGIKTVIIPQENEKDLADIPQNVKDSLKIIPVEDVTQVIEIALKNKIESIEWNEAKGVGLKAVDEKKSDLVQ